jgi:hypothetical protein
MPCAGGPRPTNEYWTRFKGQHNQATPHHRRAPHCARRDHSGAGIAQRYRVDVAKPADVVAAQATVPPGASFGWHYHRAAVVVVVKSGTLTVYDSADRGTAASGQPERTETQAQDLPKGSAALDAALGCINQPASPQQRR